MNEAGHTEIDTLLFTQPFLFPGEAWNKYSSPIPLEDKIIIVDRKENLITEVENLIN